MLFRSLLVEIDQPDFYKEYRDLIITLFSKKEDDVSDKTQDIKDLDLDEVGQKEPKPKHKKSGKEKSQSE